MCVTAVYSNAREGIKCLLMSCSAGNNTIIHFLCDNWFFLESNL